VKQHKMELNTLGVLKKNAEKKEASTEVLDEKLERINVNVPSSMHSTLKMHCLVTGTSMQTILANLLTEYVDELK
jgi:hypothetical protein